MEYHNFNIKCNVKEVIKEWVYNQTENKDTMLNEGSDYNGNRVT